MKELFPTDDLLKVKVHTSSVFWIEELRIHRQLDLKEDYLIRKVSFKQGLNVIWAEAAQREESDKQIRGKGHSAGKTTLSRFIRYALGETSFGREVLKDRLNRHSEVPPSWITANVIIGNTNWAIARPLFGSKKSFCMQNASIEELITADEKERKPYSLFGKAIEKAVHGAYPLSDFGSAKRDPITWLHSIQWLCRDQEAHMGGLFQWRAPESNSQSPELPLDKAKLLAKTLLGITNTNARDEQQKLNVSKKLKKQTAEDKLFNQRVITESLHDLKEFLPEDFKS